MNQFVLVISVYTCIMGGESEAFTKQWHVYDNYKDCKTAADNLTFAKSSGNNDDFVTIRAESVCQKFDPARHQNFYRGLK